MESSYMIGYIIGVIIGALLAGVLVGLIPFFMAKKRGFKTMGVVCLILCIVAGVIKGIIASVPVCLISVVVILIRSKKAVKDEKEDLQ